MLRPSKDAPDPTDKVMQESYEAIQGLIGDKSEKESHNILQSKAADKKGHDEVMSGLLFGILITAHKDRENVQLMLKQLTQVVRDGYRYLMTLMLKITAQLYQRLTDSARAQLAWLLNELIKLRTKQTETVVEALLRHITGGNVTLSSTWLAGAILTILNANKQWLYTNPGLIALSLYHYLRLISDHVAPIYKDLRQKEVAYCVQIMTERPAEFHSLGRDAIRLMQDAGKIPEFAPIWKRIVQPGGTVTSQSPEGNKGDIQEPSIIAQMLQTQTNPKYLAARLTPLMESHMDFMMKEVKSGHQRRYQQWFAQRYLPSPETFSLIPDLVRYICGCYHPSNAVLASNIIQRYMIVGWLMKLVRNPIQVTAVARSILVDYLFYDSNSNIMNIEPGILLMVNSIPKYIDITGILLDHLVLFVDALEPEIRDRAIRGVENAFDDITRKKVIPSLVPLFTCKEINPQIYQKLKIRFPRLFSRILPQSGTPPVGVGPSLSSPSMGGIPLGIPLPPPITLSSTSHTPVPLPHLATPGGLSPKSDAPAPLETLTASPLQSILKLHPKSSPPSPSATPSSPKVAPQNTAFKKSRKVIPQVKEETDSPNLAPLKRRKKKQLSLKPTIPVPQQLNQFLKTLELLLNPSSSTSNPTIIPSDITSDMEPSLASIESMGYEQKRKEAKKILEEFLTTLESLQAEEQTPQFLNDLAIRLTTVLSAEFSVGSFVDSDLLFILFTWADLVLPASKLPLRLDFLHHMAMKEKSLGFRILAYSLKSDHKHADKKASFGNQKQSNQSKKGSFSTLDAILYTRWVDHFTSTATSTTPSSVNHPNSVRLRLVEDLTCCRDFCQKFFSSLVAKVYKEKNLHTLTKQNVSVIKLIVASFTPTQVSFLSQMLMMGELQIFSEPEDALALMRESLKWESYDQSLAWQLLCSEYIHSSSSRRRIPTLLNLFLPFFLSTSSVESDANLEKIRKEAENKEERLKVIEAETDQTAEFMMGLSNLVHHVSSVDYQGSSPLKMNSKKTGTKSEQSSSRPSSPTQSSSNVAGNQSTNPEDEEAEFLPSKKIKNPASKNANGDELWTEENETGGGDDQESDDDIRDSEEEIDDKEDRETGEDETIEDEEQGQGSGPKKKRGRKTLSRSSNNRMQARSNTSKERNKRKRTGSENQKQKSTNRNNNLYPKETKTILIDVVKQALTLPSKPIDIARFVRLILLHWFKTFPVLIRGVVEDFLVGMHQQTVQDSASEGLKQVSLKRSDSDGKQSTVKQEELPQKRKKKSKGDEKKSKQLKSEVSTPSEDLLKKQRAVVHILSLFQMIASKVSEGEMLSDRNFIRAVNSIMESKILKAEIDWLLSAYPRSPNHYPFAKKFRSLISFFPSTSSVPSTPTSPAAPSTKPVPSSNSSAVRNTISPSQAKGKGYSIAKGRERRKPRRSSLRTGFLDEEDVIKNHRIKAQERQQQALVKENSIANARERRVIRKPKRIRDDEDGASSAPVARYNDNDEEVDEDISNQEEEDLDSKEIPPRKKKKSLDKSSSSSKSEKETSIGRRGPKHTQDMAPRARKEQAEVDELATNGETESEEQSDGDVEKEEDEVEKTSILQSYDAEGQDNITLDTESSNFFNSLKS